MTEVSEQKYLYWETYIICGFIKNLDLFAEFEFDSYDLISKKRPVFLINGSHLYETNITKKEFLQILIKVLKTKYPDHKYIISTRPKNSIFTSHYYIVVSLIQ